MALAESSQTSGIAGDQRLFLACGPSLQLTLTLDRAFRRMMLFRINDSDGQSLCGVSSAETVVVDSFAGDKVVGVANVKCAIYASEKINPRHTDDDAIVD